MAVSCLIHDCVDKTSVVIRDGKFSCLIRDCVGAVWWSHDGLSLMDDNTSLRIDLLLPINEVMRSNKFRKTDSAHG